MTIFTKKLKYYLSHKFPARQRSSYFEKKAKKKYYQLNHQDHVGSNELAYWLQGLLQMMALLLMMKYKNKKIISLRYLQKP